jgi:hypothetical protein
MGYIETGHWSVYIDPEKKAYIYKVMHKYQNAVLTKSHTKVRVDDFLVAACQALERDIDPRPRVL